MAEISSITASTVTILQDTLLWIIFRDITPYDVPRLTDSAREIRQRRPWLRERERFYTRCAAHRFREGRAKAAIASRISCRNDSGRFELDSKHDYDAVSVIVNDGGLVNVKLPATDDTS